MIATMTVAEMIVETTIDVAVVVVPEAVTVIVVVRAPVVPSVLAGKQASKLWLVVVVVVAYPTSFNRPSPRSPPPRHTHTHTHTHTHALDMAARTAPSIACWWRTFPRVQAGRYLHRRMVVGGGLGWRLVVAALGWWLVGWLAGLSPLGTAHLLLVAVLVLAVAVIP